MLVLTRKVGESIRIGADVVVTMVQVGPGKVRLGIVAPKETLILRDELEPRPAETAETLPADDSGAVQAEAA